MEDPFVQRVLEIRLGGRYQICQPLGSGTFGRVYIGRNVSTGQEVAIKLEHNSVMHSHLGEEADIYESLRGRPGMPEVYWHGFRDDYEVLVFQLLGPSLEDLFRYCNKRLSLKTTLMLMDQLLCRVQTLHTAGYLHRDIKPDNFLLGTGRQGNTVFMTDLGLATPHRATSDQDVSRSDTDPPILQLVGTRDYASINAHFRSVQSPRDDLESLGYMAVYFLSGSLPWEHLQCPKEDADRLVLECKQTTSVDVLCDGLPPEFATYMNYVRGLGNQDRPNYKYLRRLFDRLFRRNGFVYDNMFDWTLQEYDRLSSLNRPQSTTSTSINARQKTHRRRAARRGRKKRV
ncbi:hypothetical protein AYL99_03113 [Fonsecaea erecta]|uniref:non-specific serine/threonine protein kinase n=1 Tax=Fonsecaea erecta TaxID=1367422 RepID=A0A178ZWV2_9EURO|nr:hypothetical protein AYL99_03113 [Fonsecaea erecta]OAP63886.1 hypothetical protein AYL99_03113 [Fonsecaea erecta]